LSHRCREDDPLTVRRPFAVQRLAAAAAACSRKSRRGGELRARQQIFRGATIERLHEDVRLAIRIDPPVPRADREGLIDAHLELAILLFLRRFLVRLVVGRVGEHGAGEEQAFAVGAEFRRAQRRRQVRDALCLTAADYIEHVDLADFVRVTLGREGDAAAVRRP
jgi:hypothetical protein